MFLFIFVVLLILRNNGIIKYIPSLYIDINIG